MGVGGGLGSWLFCLGWEGARGVGGGHSGNSDNEGGRAACEHPRRVGGLLLVPGGHGSGWVAVGRAGRGGRASRLGWLGWLGWWSCWSLGGATKTGRIVEVASGAGVPERDGRSRWVVGAAWSPLVVVSTMAWPLCRWIWRGGAEGVRAGGGSAAGGTKCSAGIDVTRENSTKRTSRHHLGRSFSIICVMGARSIAFASCPPATRRPAAESGGGVAGVEPPAAHRYRSSAGLRVRFGGRPGSVVLEGRRRRGPGGRPVKVDAVARRFARNCRFTYAQFCEKRVRPDMHPAVHLVRSTVLAFYYPGQVSSPVYYFCD